MSAKNKLSLSEEFSDVNLGEVEATEFFLARQVVQEIRNFGVSQRTTLKIIELLALELEDRAKMLGVVAALKEQSAPPSSAIFEK